MLDDSDIKTINAMLLMSSNDTLFHVATHLRKIVDAAKENDETLNGMIKHLSTRTIEALRALEGRISKIEEILVESGAAHRTQPTKPELPN